MAPHQRCWSVRKLETLAISKCESDPITKRIQKIVFSLIVLITHSKALNLIHQMILRSPLVRHNLMERMVGVLYFSAEYITGYGNRSLVLPDGG
jgi:hypothetical protein